VFADVNSVLEALAGQNYIAERGLATAIFLAMKLKKPLFLEGEAGVGKTEVAKVLTAILQTRFIRLQCYEGLDVATALYEWNYAHQLLYLRMMEGSAAETIRAGLFTREFLQARPLLQAIEASNSGQAPVLLIDEIDRADEEFEALLLELLSDFQITIPELGTIAAAEPPIVVITSNRTREVHDALKRRCIYYWIDYPSFEKELRVLLTKAPNIQPTLARQITGFIQELRALELFKAPGVAETLDWAAALVALDQQTISPEVLADTLGVILKYQDDIDTVTQGSLKGLFDRARSRVESTVP
jgi:MoxR-like ATPase